MVSKIEKKAPEKKIKKINVFLMVILSFITMGTYIGYWFVKRSKDIERLELNHHMSFGTWKLFTGISLVLLLIQLFGGMILSEVGLLTIDSINMMFSFLFVGILYYSIFRIKEVIEENSEIEFNKYALFFMHIYYVQYKLNRTSL